MKAALKFTKALATSPAKIPIAMHVSSFSIVDLKNCFIAFSKQRKKTKMSSKKLYR